MRRLEQSTDGSSIGLDVPCSDRVACLNLEIEDRTGIKAQPVAYLLGQRESPLAGECGEHDRIPSGADYCLARSLMMSIHFRKC